MGHMVDKKSQPSVSTAPEALIEILPIAASADGRRNAYSHTCRPVASRMLYAACLNLIETDSPLAESTCKKARQGGSCPARQMRAEEITKGQAIYFSERVRHGQALVSELVTCRAPRDRIDVRELSSVGSPGGIITSGTIDFQNGDGIGGYADAINQATKPVSTQTTLVYKAGQIDVKPGESLLDIARRQLAEKE